MLVSTSAFDLLRHPLRDINQITSADSKLLVCLTLSPERQLGTICQARNTVSDTGLEPRAAARDHLPGPQHRLGYRT